MKANSHYSNVTDEIVTLLTEIVGDKNILVGDERYNYSRDEMLKSESVFPDVVVKPENADSIAMVIKLANEKHIAVTPRGGGTGLSGGAVPIYGGIVLSLEKMTRVLEIDSDNFTATVEPGVILSDFYQAVEERGLYYPLYPGETSATIGGNVATNAGGMRAVKYGVTRQSVLGLEAVLPNGEVIQTGGKFVKCSTGYDLTQLLIGSEGTLAVITKIMLKLILPPGRTEILFIPFNNLHDAIRSVPNILKEGILPIGIEFMEKDIIDMVEQYTGKEIPLHNYEAFLMIIVEADSEDEIYRIADQIGKVCLNNGAVDIFTPGSARARRNLLEAREKFYSVIGHFGSLDVADVVVPRSKIAEFVEKTKEIASTYGIPLVVYGHAGDGNVHLHPMGQEVGDSKEKAKELLVEIFKVGASLGGTISGEHGLGFAKKDYLPLAISKHTLELMRRVKLAFDPNNIMNPGKVLDIE
ncbi:FAD-binding oxidoreductase [Chloroflexota bacterium]